MLKEQIKGCLTAITSELGTGQHDASVVKSEAFTLCTLRRLCTEAIKHTWDYSDNLILKIANGDIYIITPFTSLVLRKE